MKRSPNKILMLVYILFIFIAVFTKHLYSYSKWSHISTAITVTSCVLVLSDLFESFAAILQDSVSTIKPKLQSYLPLVQHHKRINRFSHVELADEYGKSTGKTIGQTLNNIETSALHMLDTVKKEEKTKKVFIQASSTFMFAGFLLFPCTLLYEPVFSFFHNKLDGLSVLAFATILAMRFLEDELKSWTLKHGETLTALIEDIKTLNEACEKIMIASADTDTARNTQSTASNS